MKELYKKKKGKASINALFTYEDGHTIACFLTTGTEIDLFIDIIKESLA